MPSNVTITLDTTPPANPSLVINGGTSITGSQTVSCSVATTTNDATQMKFWGDVDITADPGTQATESASGWVPFSSTFPVRFSSVAGAKTLYGRLQDSVGNVTIIFSASILYDPTNPVVSLSQALDHSMISKTSPFDVASFGWQSNFPFVAYKVLVVPSASSPVTGGSQIHVTAGSVNTNGVGAFPATTTIVTTIHGADLEAASPGNTSKVVKVYVQTSGGVWSA